MGVGGDGDGDESEIGKQRERQEGARAEKRDGETERRPTALSDGRWNERTNERTNLGMVAFCGCGQVRRCRCRYQAYAVTTDNYKREGVCGVVLEWSGSDERCFFLPMRLSMLLSGEGQSFSLCCGGPIFHALVVYPSASVCALFPHVNLWPPLSTVSCRVLLKLGLPSFCYSFHVCCESC